MTGYRRIRELRAAQSGVRRRHNPVAARIESTLSVCSDCFPQILCPPDVDFHAGMMGQQSLSAQVSLLTIAVRTLWLGIERSRFHVGANCRTVKTDVLEQYNLEADHIGIHLLAEKVGDPH